MLVLAQIALSSWLFNIAAGLSSIKYEIRKIIQVRFCCTPENDQTLVERQSTKDTHTHTHTHRNRRDVLHKVRMDFPLRSKIYPAISVRKRERESCLNRTLLPGFVFWVFVLRPPPLNQTHWVSQFVVHVIVLFVCAGLCADRRIKRGKKGPIQGSAHGSISLMTVYPLLNLLWYWVPFSCLTPLFTGLQGHW